jgi:DNA-directed RNA polymerase specialized sigma24 family protein
MAPMEASGSQLIAALVANHRAFLSFLERRVGDRALAEDILQDAFAKVVARPEQAPADGTRRSTSFDGEAPLTARTRPSRGNSRPRKHRQTP